jgi:L-ascorbate metabolism protein UlaG (beta-lactamase superfamily)
MSAASLRFLGHAAFALRTPWAHLVLDPHRPGAVGGRFVLPPIEGPFDAIVSTHPHEDHAGWTPALGTTRWVERDEAFGPLRLRFCAAPHDADGGRRMGLTRLLRVDAPDFSLAHSGDIGCLDAGAVAFCRGVDVLLVAAGGTYTLGAADAAEFARRVGARVVVPMHCADPAVDLALEPAEAFFAAYAPAAGGAAAVVDADHHRDALELPPPPQLRGAVAMRRPGAP